MKSRSHVMETCKTCRSGLAFYPEHPTPKSCRTQGRRPHVPSSTITMSKSHRQDKSDNLRSPQIGRAHVRTPVTNAHLVCRLLLEKKKRKHKAIRQHTTYTKITHKHTHNNHHTPTHH